MQTAAPDGLKHVVFRADASPQIGTGHIFRCMSIATALVKAGHRCDFVIRAHPQNLADMIRAKGHQVHELPVGAPCTCHPAPPPHAPWLTGCWKQDAADTRAIVAHCQADWLIVDHYALDSLWEQHALTGSTRLAVIDDLADRPHVGDLLLDQGLGRLAESYRTRVPTDCTVLTGTSYALLRDEFAALRSVAEDRRAARDEIRTILVTLGGMDSQDNLLRVLEMLIALGMQDRFAITAIAGQGSTLATPEAQDDIWKQHGIKVLTKVTNVGELIVDADLCIGAAGGTSWERCCLGLPTLLLVMANNQIDAAQTLEQQGAGHRLGSIDALTPSLLDAGIGYFLDKNTYAKSVSAAFAVTDGKGVARFMDQLGLGHSD